MTQAVEPTIGTVGFYNPRQGHGTAITALGELRFEIPFRRENRREVEFVDGRFVWGENLREEICCFESGETQIVMQVKWTDNQTIRAGDWGFVPKSFVDRNTPAIIAPARKTFRNKKPRKRHHKRSSPAEE